MKSVITAVALCALAPGFAQAQQCFALFSGEGAAEPALMEGYSVRAATAEPGLMAMPPLPEGAGAILCDRDSVAPDANDFELVRYRGVPLYIRAGAGEDATVLLLGFQPAGQDEAGEPVPPQYLVRLPQGSITDDDRTAIVAALEGFADRESALEAHMAAAAEQDG